MIRKIASIFAGMTIVIALLVVSLTLLSVFMGLLLGNERVSSLPFTTIDAARKAMGPDVWLFVLLAAFGFLSLALLLLYTSRKRG